MGRGIRGCIKARISGKNCSIHFPITLVANQREEMLARPDLFLTPPISTTTASSSKCW